jgi:hypothetical protein
VGQFGCPLCGEYHEITFHSFPLRWSVGRDGTRSHSRVATLICPALRGTGMPYTKRILPEHLIWRSPHWSTVLVLLLEQGREGERGFIDAACDALGCIDPRTARKHILGIRAAVDAKLPILAEQVASAPGLPEGQIFPPGTNAFTILRILWDRFLSVLRARYGSYVALIFKAFLWLGPGLETWRIFNRSCIPLPDRP